MREDPPNYIDREDIMSWLDRTFQTVAVCCLRGLGGLGKSFAATKYAFRLISRGLRVGWIESDSESSILEEYRNYVRWVNQDSDPQMYGMVLKDLLSVRLVPSRVAQLLALNNVVSLSHIHPLISVAALAGTKILITARTSMGREIGISEMLVEIPSEITCFEYLQKSTHRNLARGMHTDYGGDEAIPSSPSSCRRLPSRSSIRICC